MIVQWIWSSQDVRYGRILCCQYQSSREVCCVRGIVWWECLRIGVGEEIDLVIGGERLVMVAVEVICGTFVVRKTARLHPRLSWETLPPLLGVVP